MTTPAVVLHAPSTVPLRRRFMVRVAVLAARVLARRPPERIRAILTRLQRGARPADHATVLSVRNEVVAVSLRCGGPEGCLPRSLATVLLCRLRGQWPTWCVGVRRISPFGAHAWVEAEGTSVGEVFPPGYLITFFTVPERSG